APRHQHAAYARHIVARVEQMPTAADPGLEPCGEIAGRKRRWRPDVAQIACAVARRDIHAAAEGDRQVRVVPADARAFAESFRGATRGAGVLIVEGNMSVNVIADRLHARMTGTSAAKQLPSRGRQQIRLT